MPHPRHKTFYINLTVASPRSRFPSKHMTGLIGMTTLVPPADVQSNLTQGDYQMTLWITPHCSTPQVKKKSGLMVITRTSFIQAACTARPVPCLWPIWPFRHPRRPPGSWGTVPVLSLSSASWIFLFLGNLLCFRGWIIQHKHQGLRVFPLVLHPDMMRDFKFDLQGFEFWAYIRFRLDPVTVYFLRTQPSNIIINI